MVPAQGGRLGVLVLFLAQGDENFSAANSVARKEAVKIGSWMVWFHGRDVTGGHVGRKGLDAFGEQR